MTCKHRPNTEAEEANIVDSTTKNTVANQTKVDRPPLNDFSRVHTNEFVQDYENIYKPPEFSIKELREAIPAHLFQRSLLTSSIYTIVNVIYVCSLAYLLTLSDVSFINSAKVATWLCYWWFQGIGFVGIWILAHECGHQAFSDSKSINNIIGFILHTFVLVPYFSWQISHSKHHSSASNMKGDSVYVPRTKSEYKTSSGPWVEAIETTPLFTLAKIAGLLLLGFPAYLLVNLSGQAYPGLTTHFLPTSSIFSARHRYKVIASNIGLLLWLSALYWWGLQTSSWTVIKYYGIPYLMVNAWIIVITLLQHTDVYIPKYSDKSWNFVRGALSTADRDYGWFLNHAFHHITDSHVVHHLFSQMPFYNAVKATPYIKAALGEYYLYDETPIAKALWRAAKRCLYVEDDGDVLFYRH